jgi:uncharacterized protein with PQ loop repeat
MYETIEILGWIASIVFALCGAPQAYKSYKDGHTRGLSFGLLIMWSIGEILMLTYVALKYNTDYQLIINNILNLVILAIIWKYALWPRKKVRKSRKKVIDKES